MTELLAHAISEIKKLPKADQDAIAQRLLAELKDEKAWQDSFAATTDEQWDKMAEKVRKDIRLGKMTPIEEVFPADT
ncbi:MAG: hypothetical protein WA885_03090 [Phormidesmis sp.]